MLCLYRSHLYQGSSFTEEKESRALGHQLPCTKWEKMVSLGREVWDVLPCHVLPRPGKSKRWQEFSKRGKTPSLVSQQYLTVPVWLLAALPKCCTALARGETTCQMPSAVGPGPAPLMAPQRLMLNVEGTGQGNSTACRYLVPFAVSSAVHRHLPWKAYSREHRHRKLGPQREIALVQAPGSMLSLCSCPEIPQTLEEPQVKGQV